MMGYCELNANRAFRRYLEANGATFDDLTSSDNRERVDNVKNLDFVIRTRRRLAYGVEVKAAKMSKGSLQPSRLWVASDDLKALSMWKRDNPHGCAVIVGLFYSDSDSELSDADLKFNGLTVQIWFIELEDWKANMKVASQKETWSSFRLKPGTFSRVAKRFSTVAM